MSDTFVPHSVCSVPSGDCFVEGRCLDRCKKRNATLTLAQCREILERMVQLEVRVIRLERELKK
jgi:hypothetical protein